MEPLEGIASVVIKIGPVEGWRSMHSGRPPSTDTARFPTSCGDYSNLRCFWGRGGQCGPAQPSPSIRLRLLVFENVAGDDLADHRFALIGPALARFPANNSVLPLLQ